VLCIQVSVKEPSCKQPLHTPCNKLRLTCISGVQLFYRAHVIGSILFVMFGIFHYSGNYMWMLTGLAVYGIDVAYRWFQTTSQVSVQVSSSEDMKMLSIIVPLQVCLHCAQSPCQEYAQCPHLAQRPIYALCLRDVPLKTVNLQFIAAALPQSTMMHQHILPMMFTTLCIQANEEYVASERSTVSVYLSGWWTLVQHGLLVTCVPEKPISDPVSGSTTNAAPQLPTLQT
jgi:hypothetical protein